MFRKRAQCKYLDMQGFFEANILTTLTYAEDASSGNTTIPLFVVQDVATAIRFAPAVVAQGSQCAWLGFLLVPDAHAHCETVSTRGSRKTGVGWEHESFAEYVSIYNA